MRCAKHVWCRMGRRCDGAEINEDVLAASVFVFLMVEFGLQWIILIE